MITSATGRLLLGVLCGFVFGVVLYQSSGMGGGFSFRSLKASVIPDGVCAYSPGVGGCPNGTTTDGIYCFAPAGTTCQKNGKPGTCDAGSCIESAPTPVSSCTYPIPAGGCPPGQSGITTCFESEGTPCQLSGSTGTCNATGTCVSTPNPSPGPGSTASVTTTSCTSCTTCITSCAVTPGRDCLSLCATECAGCFSSSSSSLQMSIPAYGYYCCTAGVCSAITNVSQCTGQNLFQDQQSCQSSCVVSSPANVPSSSSIASSQSLCCDGNQCVPYIPATTPTCNPACVAPQKCVKDPADPAPHCV